MQEKLKAEAEGSARLRKQVAELTVAKSANEQIHVELQGMLSTLQQQRDALQQEVAVLQGQLSQEKSSRTQASDLQQELEGIFPLLALASMICYPCGLLAVLLCGTVISLTSFALIYNVCNAFPMVVSCLLRFC
jgi:hypothetical protein